MYCIRCEHYNNTMHIITMCSSYTIELQLVWKTTMHTQNNNLAKGKLCIVLHKISVVLCYTGLFVGGSMGKVYFVFIK